MSTADILPFFDGQWIIFQKNTLNRFYFWQTLYFCWRVLPCFLWSWITISSLSFPRKFPFWFLSKTLLPTLDFRCDRNWRVWWNIDWQVDINFTNHLRLSETKSLSSFYRSKWILKTYPSLDIKLAFLVGCFKIGFKPIENVLSLLLKVALEKDEDVGRLFFLTTIGFSCFVTEIFLVM